MKLILWLLLSLSLPALGAQSSGVVSSSFVQQGTGAGARSFLDKARDTYHVKDFRNTNGTPVRCNGVQDDVSGIQRAITRVQTVGGRLVLPNSRCRVTAALTITTTAGMVLEGEGYASELYFAPSSVIDTALVVTASNDVEVTRLRLSAASNVGRGLYIANSTNVRVHRVTQSGATAQAVSGPVCGICSAASSDVWITDNTVSGNGFIASGAAVYNESYDIAHYTGGASARVHIRNNKVSGSSTAKSIFIFDALDSDIIGNEIDQNNKIGTAADATGYGVGVYAATSSAITAATNAAAASLTVTGHGRATGDTIYIGAATGNWAAINGFWTITVTGANTFTIPVNSTAFGALAGSPVLSAMQRVRIESNRIRNTAGNGIYIASASFIVANGNELENVVQQQTAGGGIPLAAIAVNAAAHSTFSFNAITRSTRNGIRIINSTHTTLASNAIKGAALSGIDLSSLPGNVNLTVTGNLIEGSTGAAISAESPYLLYRSTINGNTIRAPGTHGIDLGGAVDSIIAANSITSPVAGTAIRVQDATNSARVSITGNAISGVPTNWQAILPYGAYHTVSGNTAHCASTTNTIGIHMGAATDSTVGSNTVTGCATGLYGGSARVVVEGNSLTGNTTPITAGATDSIHGNRTATGSTAFAVTGDASVSGALSVASCVGCGGGGSVILAGSAGATQVASGSTGYATASGTSHNATENARQITLPRACTIGNLYVTTTTAQPAAGALTATVRKNGANTTVAVTIAANAAAGNFSDTVNTASFAAGDTFGLALVNPGASASANVAGFAVTCS